MRYLCEVTTRRPADLDDDAWQELLSREWTVGRRLLAEGTIVDIWRVAQGQMASVSLWEAASQPEVQGMLQTLPLAPWQTVRILALMPHPVTVGDYAEDGDRAGGDSSADGETVDPGRGVR
jgi:muconolactone delta-isomerase